MSEKVMLIAGMAHHIPQMEDCDYIGIDRGAWIAMQENITLKCAIGDFDSISEKEKNRIESHYPIMQLPQHKDETDTEQALLYAMEQGYKEIILYGGLGGRMDHTLANLHLLMHRDLPLVLMDEHHEIRKLKKGNYTIIPKFKYLSFLALEKTIITEKKVAYPLQKRLISQKDIYTISNEILNDYAEIIIHEGSVLIIQCEDC